MALAHRADGPDQMISHARRTPSSECPWLPICVATLYFRAASASWRASHTVCVSGFCTKTCLPNAIAIMAAG